MLCIYWFARYHSPPWTLCCSMCIKINSCHNGVFCAIFSKGLRRQLSFSTIAKTAIENCPEHSTLVQDFRQSFTTNKYFRQSRLTFECLLRLSIVHPDFRKSETTTDTRCDIPPSGSPYGNSTIPTTFLYAIVILAYISRVSVPSQNGGYKKCAK